MNPIETLLSKKMKEAEPALDIQGSDRKILQTAYQDFMNYLKFTWKADQETDQYALGEKVLKSLQEETAEFEAFLTVWMGMWLKKWKQRVKLYIGNQPLNPMKASSKVSAGVECPAKVLEHKQEMLDMIVSTLVKNAEICGTQILAENLLKIEVERIKDSEINSPEQMLSILNGSLRRARETAQNVGPLIFVKVDKNYYKAATQQAKPTVAD